ncbi:PREDICTED: phospholipase D alpha 4 isoform X2 [Tarenaya hassleriana]|uniref:phospholipase D alpha 4 isoform X2 n=1 Tax=Tarenaya hassleriana TaxID=28532 RepID=UPI00053C2CE5|nr:PREDICTED: phospholipase D alpha 4 isoform X2 [Tarenaya hassleriana]
MEEDQKKFLHGTLEFTIFDATPYSPPFPLSCIITRPKPAYVTIKLNKKRVAKTSSERDRVWNQTFQILCAHRAADTAITITLKTRCSVLGRFHVTAEQILSSDPAIIHGFFPLVAEKGTNPSPNLKLKFLMWFIPAYHQPGWSRVIEGQSPFRGIKNASFPQRSNCRVVLYQDAHHNTGFDPRVSDVSWNPRNLWEDVYRAIEGARHLVYIAGWALNPNLVLVRDMESEIPHAIGVAIGELLKRKAEEGVAVRIMLWNDETSLPLIKNKGLMRTDDETAFSYFRNTKVVCRLCPRSHNKLPTAFAHHQKTITVDSRVPDTTTNEREIVSFIGGLDLYDGRYDTEEHSLFRTLGKNHSKFPDFYQTSVSGAKLSRGGPREPWHDCHACVMGEAASDILRNFEQRWTKQCDPSLLVNTSAIRNLVTDPSRTRGKQDGTWNIQVFRSIDHVSATEMPRGLSVEKSIHDAYIEAIRRAERFIYIENQYFMGSCDQWENKNDRVGSGCTNLIPVEIALKIAAKIRDRERFAVYIVMPMWPEGPPDSEAVEEILHWTRETTAMMYRIIGEAIREEIGYNDEIHPKDYLNFFCLANREEKRDGDFTANSSPRPNTHYWNAQRNRRFMVYVHSKLMIVDDAYLLIGSANINQRSMDGSRDTEIVIGCYQPERQIDVNDIRAYRISLWYEHTGGLITPDELSSWEPESPECVRGLRVMGERMWGVYSGDEVVDMGGAHLVTYPISVTKDGEVEDISDGVFPDTKTPVKGKRSRMLPPILTT